MTTPLAWQAALLLPQPPLSLLYLLALRTERLRPSFVPLALLAAAPLASAVVGAAALRSPAAGSRGWHAALLVGAGVELAWTLLAEAMVGFAIAWRSG